jgi:hypothetical protein|tara:strand:+ start:5600 stop:5767 length:168 start_codon:yes stop_codon:yes gene_type:complete
MAQIHEEILIIKFSRLIPSTGIHSVMTVTEDLIEAMQTVAAQLAGDTVIVEVEKA